MTLQEAAGLQADDVLKRLSSTPGGLTSSEAARRLEKFGLNALHAQRPTLFAALSRQLHNPLLALLVATAAISIVLRDQTDALIILCIVVLSVGLGVVNEYRSERAIADLHARVRHTARALRDGRLVRLDVTALVPGDVVVLELGDVIAADVRLLESASLECDEAILTGESMPVEKTSCAFMGTIVRAGSARAVVVHTGASTELGRIAGHLADRIPISAFQRGLGDFTRLLVWITTIVTVVVFLVNLFIRPSALESLMFALAIAVSLTPQLLPAIVTVSLATGARRMARRSVLVKRLVSIEDFGNMTVLFTDKTGTLTEGRATFTAALGLDGKESQEVLRLGLLCSTADMAEGPAALANVTNALDMALEVSTQARSVKLEDWHRLGVAPFDHERRLISVLVDDGKQRLIITKGAPESVLARCATVPPPFQALLAGQFSAGARVVAIATRDASDLTAITPAEEHDLVPVGFLVFVDPPKTGAAAAIERFKRLGVDVKVLTGDNELVAQKVCSDLAIPVRGVLTGSNLDAMNDQEAATATLTTTIFARVNPEQKSRLILLARASGSDVGYLGDGVNDALALHSADVGLSVESAVDVAKDAADIVLVTKDLNILADGVVEGRRIFTNTIKYLLMATSSNFGNLISTAAGSLVLPFLPLLPSQILLNNLLYDVSEMTIPTDNVDEEQLRRPAHWDMNLIRRFMIVFGPINSLFDFSVFAVMLIGFHAGASLFRSGFFVESFVTQTLIVFAIRTRRVPFFRSQPGAALTATTLIVAIIGGSLPYSPLGALFGFATLPASFLGVIAAMVVVYIVLVETAKSCFFRDVAPQAQQPSSSSPLHRFFSRRGEA